MSSTVLLFSFHNKKETQMLFVLSRHNISVIITKSGLSTNSSLDQQSECVEKGKWNYNLARTSNVNRLMNSELQ